MSHDYSFFVTSDEVEILEANALISQKLQSGPVVGNKRKVSALLLSPPSSTGTTSSSSSGSSTASVNFSGFRNAQNIPNFELPMSLHSAEALEWCGFVPGAAQTIYQRWFNRGEIDIHGELIDYAIGYIALLRSSAFQEQWTEDEQMEKVGINQQIRQAILDSNFRDVYGTEDLPFWVKDTIRVNYSALEDRIRRLKETVVKLGKKPQNKRPKLKGAFGQEESSGAASTSSQPTNSATISAISEAQSEWQQFSQGTVLVQEAGSELPGHVTLWKGKSPYELSANLIRDDGSINHNALLTTGGGDFNMTQPAWYWTHEKETAERYRRYAENRSPLVETWLIRIQVPQSFMTELGHSDLCYSPNFKEFVWYCRRKTDDLPQKFEQLANSRVVLGHISAANSTKYLRMKPQNVQQRFPEDQLMKHGNIKATQWVVTKEPDARLLMANVRGKMHIEVIAPRDL